MLRSTSSPDRWKLNRVWERTQGEINVTFQIGETQTTHADMTILQFAALLGFLLGVAHSVLGERYILTRLFRRENLPTLFGGTEFTTRTLRFAWHLTTIAL